MKRRWFAVMGGLLLVGILALVWVLGPVVLTTPAALLLVVSAGLFILGGFDPLPAQVPWYRFIGVGELLVGAVFVVGLVAPALEGGRTARDLFLALVGVANGLFLGFIGLDWFRGGNHYDLSRFDPGPIFGDGDEP